MTQLTSLPKFSNDLGGFAGRLRIQLFTSQEKAAQYFGIKSHGTISRYESEVLRPPLGYLTNLVKLYVDRLAGDDESVTAHQKHFLQEINRAIHQCYSWDEPPFHTWHELCGTADEFLAKRRAGNEPKKAAKLQPELTANNNRSETEPVTAKSLRGYLSEFLDLQTLPFLVADLDKQRQLRNRQALLKLVDEVWIKGLLEESLYNLVLLELGMQEKPEAIEPTWNMMYRTSDQQPRPLPAGLKLLDAFNQMGQCLLVLGQPGSGKTTLLLDLTRELIAQANTTPLQPIPVVFTLSSWNVSKLSIADWLVDELLAKYRIPKKIGRPWVENDELLLLLDGLDEVAETQREACVQAINRFRQEHLAPIVVTSRTADYQALSTRLHLQGAVLLQPLTGEQIETYLARFDAKSTFLQRLLQEDTELGELAQTPLMLNIMLLAYEGTDVETSPRHIAPTTLRRYLFEAYIERMLERKHYQGKPYPDRLTKHWLNQLAKQMTRRNQTVFLLENLQPDWLPNDGWIHSYVLISRLVAGLYNGLLIGIGVGIGSIQLLHLEQAISSGLNRWVLSGLAIGVITGLLFGLIDTLRLSQNKKQINNTSKSSQLHETSSRMKTVSYLLLATSYSLVSQEIALRQFLTYFLTAGCLAGIVSGFMFTWVGGWVLGIIGGLVVGLGFGLFVATRSHQNILTGDIQPTESLSWSWKKAIRVWPVGAGVGLVCGMSVGWVIILNEALLRHWSAGPLVTLFGEANFVLVCGLVAAGILGLVSAQFGGLSNGVVETKIKPNQGIWLSIKYALSAGLSFSLITAVFGGLLSWLLSGDVWSGLAFGLILILAYGGLAFQWYGGLDVAQHYLLRLMLYCLNQMPLNHVRFLDYAADRILLKKVGGGYIFIHRLLLDYFAELDTDD